MSHLWKSHVYVIHTYIHTYIQSCIHLWISITEGLSGAAAQENYQHLSLHTSQQHESIAKGILGKLFSPYTAVGAKIGAPSTTNPNSIENCVEFNNFARFIRQEFSYLFLIVDIVFHFWFPYRVMRSFHFPGAPPVKLEAIQLLFDLCSFRVVDRNGAAVHVPILNEEGRKVASPALLVKVHSTSPSLLSSEEKK